MILLSLVTQHGGRRVYAAGLTALGYPPTWATMAGEVFTVKKSLIQKGEENGAR